MIRWRFSMIYVYKMKKKNSKYMTLPRLITLVHSLNLRKNKQYENNVRKKNIHFWNHANKKVTKWIESRKISTWTVEDKTRVRNKGTYWDHFYSLLSNKGTTQGDVLRPFLFCTLKQGSTQGDILRPFLFLTFFTLKLYKWVFIEIESLNRKIEDLRHFFSLFFLLKKGIVVVHLWNTRNLTKEPVRIAHCI